jgi:hypothetical protein
MNAHHVDFAEWDAAYVMGALSPSDRRAFEVHLETCERCRQAIAEIAPTIGLLARIDRTRAESLAAEPAVMADAGPPQALREGLVSSARRERLRRQRTWWFGGLAAAAVLVAAIVVALNVAVAPALRSTQTFALESVRSAPLSASVELADVAWGTRIGLVCRYDDVPGSGAPEDGWPYSLYVIDENGAASQVSTWRALPGSTARLDAATDLDVSEMSAIEIRSLGGDDVFMRVELDSADG